MDLFSHESTHNILPYDGVVNYYGIIFPATKAQQLFTTLLNTIAFKNDEAIVFGKHIVTKRKVAWYGDTPYFYHYSGHTKQALVWTPELLELKTEIEKISGATYNSCLINLYHDGNEGVSWHSDDEKTLKKHAPIASLSLGAERKFSFKHKQNKQTLSLILQNGSLLVMKDSTQTHWLHALPKSTKVTKARISLTFRTIVNQNE